MSVRSFRAMSVGSEASSGGSIRLGIASLLSLVGCACASHSHGTVGYSTTVETSAAEERNFADEAEAAREEPDDEATSEAPEDGVDEGSVDESTTDEEPPEAALARKALHRSSGEKNHLGLAFAVFQRASDLPWLFAIENRSPETVTLAALPELLGLTVTPPAPKQDETSAEAVAAKAPDAAKAPNPFECGGANLPKTLALEEKVDLRPGELIFHAFDPTELCENLDEVLIEGAKIEARYGFPNDTKKLWKGGKLTTVEVEQKAPFVAERKSTSEEFVPLKHLTAEPFVLGITYPLDSVQPFAPVTTDEGESASASDATPGGARSEPPPPPPLTLSIAELGTTSSPEDRNVQVTVRNTSGKEMRLFVRRELLAYEVIGPAGAATCRMHPTERAPDRSAFRSLPTGGSTTITTRLAEACPPGTWDVPGAYSVSARFEANDAGDEYEIDAFVGIGVTTKPARLTVPGDKDEERRSMIIVPSRPPE